MEEVGRSPDGILRGTRRSEMNPDADQQFDGYAEEYARHVTDALPPGVGEVDKFARIKVWHLRRELARLGLTRPDLSILDAGCGIGITDSFLKAHFSNITGLDISQKSIEVAKAKNPELAYSRYDGGQFPFEESRFDIAFAMCVVHHIPPAEWPVFFANMFRVIKPGGVLLIYEHNPWNPLTRWVVSRCEFDCDAVLIDAPQCARQAAEAGFSDLRSKFILFAPFEPPAWSRVEEALFSGIPIGAQYQLSACKAHR